MLLQITQSWPSMCLQITPFIVVCRPANHTVKIFDLPANHTIIVFTSPVGHKTCNTQSKVVIPCNSKCCHLTVTCLCSCQSCYITISKFLPVTVLSLTASMNFSATYTVSKHDRRVIWACVQASTGWVGGKLLNTCLDHNCFAENRRF